jgi:signal transduction histidine kinase
VPVETDLRHVGGGPKGLFLAVRYVFILSAAYLLVFHGPRGPLAPAQALTIAAALASNVALSAVPPAVLFAVRVAAPLLIADTVWVSWALHASGALGSEFFVLYVFVLLLAAVGENLLVVVLGAIVASAVNVYTSWGGPTWTSPVLLRVVFLFTVAVFYGHVLSRLKSERRRGDRSEEWARLLEAKVIERTAELNRLYEASRAASQAKSEFMASMSHELRTPLHIIIGHADMLLDGAATTPAEGAALGGPVRRAATGLLELVDGVLEMGRLEAGKVRIEPQAVPVAAVADALRRREWIMPLPGVTLRWEVESCPTVIHTDPVKLRIIVANLVTNALKYTREGEVVVSVRDHPPARRVDFRVDDTGPGIPSPLLSRIREPFHESSGPGAHKLEGVGLGLAIVYGYAALLGVEVSVRSTVGRGTSFMVAVPYRFGSGGTEAAGAASAGAWGSGSGPVA